MERHPTMEEGVCTGLGRGVDHRYRLEEAGTSTNHGKQELVPSAWGKWSTYVDVYVRKPPLRHREVTYMGFFHFTRLCAQAGVAFGYIVSDLSLHFGPEVTSSCPSDCLRGTRMVSIVICFNKLFPELVWHQGAGFIRRNFTE